MQNAVRILAAAVALGLSAPAAAQYTFTQPGQVPPPAVQPVPAWNNVLRVNVGVGFYNSGWATCYGGYWPGYWPTCYTGSYSDYIPFVVGPQADFNLGGMNNVSGIFRPLPVGTPAGAPPVSGADRG